MIDNNDNATADGKAGNGGAEGPTQANNPTVSGANATGASISTTTNEQTMLGVNQLLNGSSMAYSASCAQPDQQGGVQQPLEVAAMLNQPQGQFGAMAGLQPTAADGAATSAGAAQVPDMSAVGAESVDQSQTEQQVPNMVPLTSMHTMGSVPMGAQQHMPAANGGVRMQSPMAQSMAPKKEWHTQDNYDAQRDKVQQNIMTLLLSKRPNPTEEWKSRLPQMTKRLEESLYRNANSFEEYVDGSTLKQRLQQLALSMRNYNHQRGQASGAQAGVASGRGMPPPMGMSPSMMPGMQQQGFSMPYNAMLAGAQGQFMGQQGMQQGVYMQPGIVGGQQQQQYPINMAAINPMMASSNGGQQMNMVPGMASMQPAQTGAGGQEQRHTEEHRRAVLKQQQQRLLLLRHASKCRYENTPCPVTNHCRSMKDLWKHIMSCKDTKCTVAHCVSSRYVLSHYSKCKDVECPVCGPVRQRIKKNYEQGQRIVEMSRRSQVHHQAHHQIPQQQLQRRRMQSEGELDPVSCPMYNFTDEQIQSHLKNIQEGMKMTASKIKEVCMPIIDEFLRNKHGAAYFREAVDPIALQIPDYFDIVKMPMDLGTVKKRLETSCYRDVKHFERDTHLVFDNAMLYNPKQCEVHMVAKQFKRDFNDAYKRQMAKLEKTMQEGRQNPEHCRVCGEGQLHYEPPVYHCNGRCGGQRIRRNSHFYTGGQDEYHWCASCFTDLKDGAIKLPTGTFYKADIQKSKRKHDVEIKEPWVACDVCNRWVHQICGMFNQRQNLGDELAYVCPYCLLERRKNTPDKCKVTKKPKMRAKDLAHTVMTRFLEKRVREKLTEKEDERASLEGKTGDDVERCPLVTVRQVSCVDKKHAVRDGMAQRYAFKNYPVEFPVRTKCIVIFQQVDGQDVLIFGLYVYEYGHQCPQPNHRRVYISYLDSVNYFRPKHFRTPCYQELMVSYLDYVKARGFHTAHIWSCPPSKGDDYILYQHPTDQKTPKEDRLRAWYDEILADAKERDIVCEITDLFAEYCENKENDATVLPYFEGDYWVNEAEDIIKTVNQKSGGAVKASLALQNGTLEEDKADEEETPAASNKRKQKRTRATRSVSHAGFGIRDPVMAKLADMVKKMRAALYVAKLRPDEYAAEQWEERQKEIEVEEQEEKDAKRMKPGSAAQESYDVAQKVAAKVADTSGTSAQKDGEYGVPSSSSSSSSSADMSGKEKEGDVDVTATESAAAAADEGQGKVEGQGATDSDNKMDTDDGEAEAKPAADTEAETSRGGAADAEGEVAVKSEEGGEVKKEGGGAVVCEPCDDARGDKEKEGEGGQPGAEGVEVKKEESIVEEVDSEEDNEEPVDLSTLKDDTSDPDDIIENQYFTTRLEFLDMCMRSHYQFDQLRRSKHTTMMMLYHMHNPDAPKFLPKCDIDTCNVDIMVGYRYHCDSCDIDICQKCVQILGTARAHPQHGLRPIPMGGTQKVKLTEEQRKERQRSIRVHLQLLQHSSTCRGFADNCKSRHCQKMKEFLKHGRECRSGVKHGCPNCKRIYDLLQWHARQCRVDDCPVFRCQEIRRHIKSMQSRQQAMDDRRRQMMNQMYSQGVPGSEP